MRYLCPKSTTPHASQGQAHGSPRHTRERDAALIRKAAFCSGSWFLSDSKARTVARGGLCSHCARSCRVGGSDAARVSSATSARTVARRRDARPGLRLSFVTHLRYNEPDRLFPFPHRLLHAASASGGWTMTFEEILDQA